MNTENLKPGDIIKFTYMAEKSAEPVQNVELRINYITENHINGVNVNRILDGSHDKLPYRTYKMKNIVAGTFYLKIG